MKLKILLNILLLTLTFGISHAQSKNVIEFDVNQAILITKENISEKRKKELLQQAFLLEKEQKIIKFVNQHKKTLKNTKNLIFVDYSMSISKKRFFVFDLKEKKIIYSTYVGHSGYSGEDIPFDTSNTPRTRKTSLGLYRVGRTYYGRFGKSKKLHGLSNTNSNAYKRAIVAHSMRGNSFEDLYSWGCFTFFKRDLKVVFHFMKKGTHLIATD